MKYFIFITILVLGVSLILPFSIQALTVSPIRFEIEGNPGQILTGEIELFNEQTISRTFYSSFENFQARGEGGEPHFLPEQKGLATWINIDELRVVLEPNERRKIPFTITIPKEAEPGGHFAAIFWGTTPPIPDGEGVVVGARLGVLVLLTVDGEIKEGGGILEFRTENRFFTSLPITLFYRFANDSGDRIMPKGEIKIRNILGIEIAIMDANPVLGNVLPASIRRFEVQWDKTPNNTKLDTKTLNNTKGFFEIVEHQWQNFAFGMYTAELSLSWREQTTNAIWRFFVIPWQLLSIILIILIIVGFFAVIGIKRYNRWIIAKATSNKQQETI